MPIWKTPLIAGISLVSIFLFGGCSINRENNSAITPAPSVHKEETATNIAKVLNRIECDDSNVHCRDEHKHAIWQSCISRGYTTSLPEAHVTSSRDIKELVVTPLVKTRELSRTEPSTDSIGIVATRKVLYTTKETIYIKGYCVGSEYIMAS